MKIAVDFDGTVVDHRYPGIGPDAPLAVDTLKDLIAVGHKIILYTMRSDEKLLEAVEWFEKNDIELYGIQVDPGQIKWSKSNKCHADVCIDDRNLGCPLIKIKGFNRLCVDWRGVRDHFRLDEAK